MRAALHLTSQERSRAEDLLQTVFVQFTLARPDLQAIRNLDDYLFVSLRNTHLSQARRSGIEEASGLSVVDYDCAEMRLREVLPDSRLAVEDELWVVCRWAAERKRTAKDGSILILRFFHGYYPSEIARLAKISGGAVDKAMQSAREAARAYLAQPAVTNNAVGCPHRLRGPEDFLARAQAFLFEYPEGPCLSRETLRRLYELETTPPGRGILAHLASCPVCLGEAGRIVGVGSPGDRDPWDTLGPQGPTLLDAGLGNGAGGRAKERFRRKSQRLRMQIVEHRPTVLFVAVNGLTRCSHTVHGNSNRLTMRLPSEEQTSAVEVHSEQGVHLLLLNVEHPPKGDLQQGATVLLGEQSKSRTITARVDFTSLPGSLEVAYRDSANDPTPSLSREDVERASAPATMLEPALRRPVQEFLGTLRLSRFSDLTLGTAWKRALAGGVSILAIAAVLLNQNSSLSAATILQRSAKLERSAPPAGKAAHRVLSLEQRSIPDRHLIARRRIEFWKGQREQQTAIRAYDDAGRLTSGEWISREGQRTFYRHGSVPVAAQEKADLAALSIDELAMLPPSGSAIQKLMEGRISEATVSCGPNRWRLDWKEHETPIRTASVVFDGNSFRVIEETLVVEAGGESREIHYLENRSELQEIASLPPITFTPDSDLAPAADNRMVTRGLGPRPEESRSTMKAPEGTAFAIIQALDRVHALEGEQIDLRLAPDGVLVVEGLVEDEARLETILTSLHSISHDPGVRIALNTTAASARQQRPSRLVRREYGVKDGAIEAEVELSRYFEQRGVASDAIHEETGRLRSLVLERSLEARRHGRAVLQISRWLPETQVAPTEMDGWKEMVRAHAAVCHQATADIDRLLRPVFQPNVTLPLSPVEGTLDDLIRRLSSRTVEVDQVLVNAWSLPTEGNAHRSLHDPAFWLALPEAGQTADEIEERMRH